jgi:hypothetical protein
MLFYEVLVPLIPYWELHGMLSNTTNLVWVWMTHLNNAADFLLEINLSK